MGWCLPRAARRLKKPGRQPMSLLPTETQQRLHDIRRLFASRARLGVPPTPLGQRRDRSAGASARTDTKMTVAAERLAGIAAGPPPLTAASPLLGLTPA